MSAQETKLEEPSPRQEQNCLTLKIRNPQSACEPGHIELARIASFG
jgi:hypothetical protein